MSAVTLGLHRFASPLDVPAAAPPLWLRARADAAGTPPGERRFWDADDLWCRHLDDGGTAHQDPARDRDNVFCARVHNRGSSIARHFLVTFSVRPWLTTTLSYPQDWLPCAAAVTDFGLGPGEERVVTARWPGALVPPPGAPACWVASVLIGSHHPVVGDRPAERPDLAQKNLAVVEPRPGEWATVPFLVPPRERSQPVLLELRRPPGLEALQATLCHGGSVGHRFAPGERAVVRLSPRRGAWAFDLGLRLPAGEAGEGTLDLVQREATGRRRVVGGLAVRLSRRR